MVVAVTSDDALGLILGFEVYAAISKRFPLVTTLCRQYPVLIVPVVLATIGHLRRRPVVVVVAPV